MLDTAWPPVPFRMYLLRIRISWWPLMLESMYEFQSKLQCCFRSLSVHIMTLMMRNRRGRINEVCIRWLVLIYD